MATRRPARKAELRWRTHQGAHSLVGALTGPHGTRRRQRRKWASTEFQGTRPIFETVDAQGHLIDSGDLRAILTTIVKHGASDEILHVDVGRTNADASRRSLRVATASRESRDHLLSTRSNLACSVKDAPDALLRQPLIEIGRSPRSGRQRPLRAACASGRQGGRPA